MHGLIRELAVPVLGRADRCGGGRGGVLTQTAMAHGDERSHHETVESRGRAARS